MSVRNGNVFPISEFACHSIVTIPACLTLRWYVACLKNFFESWRAWHGKKMAVKGVLDQVVDMM